MDVRVPFGSHVLAIQQARAHATVAASIGAAEGAKDDAGSVLAFCVNSGLSIELYLKTLMLVARGGRVSKGHELASLYGEFPDFLRANLEKLFEAAKPSEPWLINLLALRFGDVPPPPPVGVKRPRFETFSQTIEGMSVAFERCRYFYEGLAQSEWAVIEYAPAPVKAATDALDRTYRQFMANEFAGIQFNANP